MKHFKTFIFITSILVSGYEDLFSQNSQFLEEWYWGQGDYQYYILNKDVIHNHVSSDIDLFCEPYNGAIVYQENSDDLLSFIVDPFWNRIIYSKYNDDWIKDYGVYGSGQGQFKNLNAVSTDGLGNLYIADTYNSRIVKLQYDATNEEIDAGTFSTIGEGILISPWDLDVDDRGNNNNTSDDIIWVVDNGINQIVPFNLSGTIVSNGPITHLYNSSTGTTYWDLSGL